MTEQLKADAKALFEREGGLDHLIVTPEVSGYAPQLFYPRDRQYALNLVGGDASRLTILAREDVSSAAPTQAVSQDTPDADTPKQDDTQEPAKGADEPPADDPPAAPKATKKGGQTAR